MKFTPINVKKITEDELKFYIEKIKNFYSSEKYANMKIGLRYFKGKQDILNRSRKIIGPDGELCPIHNLPNNHIVDNQYRKAVEQKLNYILGKPIKLVFEDKAYGNDVVNILGNNFNILLRRIALDSINCGIGWLYVYYDSYGNFHFERFSPLEIIPIWENKNCDRLREFIRCITVEDKKIIEIYRKDGIHTFTFLNNNTTAQNYTYKAYFKINDKNYTWSIAPLIPFKYNYDEMPLISSVKSLQDGINLIESDFINIMQEDYRNSILILVNYDGEDLGEFRRNLAEYGAVKVEGGEGGGDVRSLKVEVNAENYLSILSVFKRAFVENAKAFDIRDEKSGRNTNQLSIKSLYSDLNLDANGMESEFSSSLLHLLSLVNIHLFNFAHKEYKNTSLEILFNRDILISESEAINNIIRSKDLISQETLLAHHPWVKDIPKEIELMHKIKHQN